VLENAEALGFEQYNHTVMKGDYGLQNTHEFIAELANPVFREKLKQVAVFDDTVKAITEVATGVEKTETAYDRLSKALYQIMDNYDPDFGEKYEQVKAGNIKMNSTEYSGSLKEATAEKGGISLSEQRQPEKESIERKSYDWYEKQIKQSDEKVKDATFELARQPENQERKDALEAALNEKTALVLERDFGVSSPKLVDLRRQQENLGDVQKHFSEHIALNEAFKAELAQLQKSLPKDFMSAGTKETLKKLFDTPSQNKVVMQSKLDYLKNPELVKNADLSNQQIKNALTEALSHKDKDIRLKAIASPQMKDEWLEKVVEKHRCPETVCEAKNALQEKAVAKQFSGSTSIATLQNSLASLNEHNNLPAETTNSTSQSIASTHEKETLMNDVDTEMDR
jgi:hypothetical protein